ncbi:MAG: hypothetical protein AAF202_07805, partial [Pseudomonadota bacterium]
SESHDWYVDSLAPVVEITSGPKDPSTTTDAKFEFTVNDPTAVTTCRLNSASPVPCQTGMVFQAQQGQNQFQVIARDRLGNTGTSRIYTWFVDSVPPSVSITTGPDNPTNQTLAPFEFVVDDPTADVKCSLNGSAYLLCKTGEEFQAKEGQNNFRVQATDPYGYVGYSVPYTWYVDSIAPGVEITSGPDELTNDPVAIFEFNSPDDLEAVFECSLNAAAYVACKSGDSFEVSEDGENTFRVIAIDSYGNRSEPTEPYIWVLDTKAPVIEFLTTPSNPTSDLVADFTYSVEDDSAVNEESLQCELNGLVIDCPTLGEISTDQAIEGENTIKVSVEDDAGNQGEATSKWVYEYSAPDPDPTPDPICVTDNFEQPPVDDAKKLDVLFVVDSSASMDPEKRAVADGINKFIDELPDDTDYRLAVLPGHGVGSNYYGKLIHFYKNGGEKVYTLSHQDSLSFLQDELKSTLINLPEQYSTDGGEAGLASLHQMLTGNNGQNLELAKSQGIFRDEAALAIVFIADENDICSVAPDGVTFVVDNQYQEGPAFDANCVEQNVTPETVYQALKDAKGNEPLMVTGVIYNGDNPVPSGGENELGYGLLETI